MAAQPLPPDVARVFDGMPDATEVCARALRDLVMTVADEVGVAPVQETLKWGEPAYLPGRAGTTVRISADKDGRTCKLLVNCQTSLVDDWRHLFGDRLEFEGSRAVRIDPTGPLDTEALAVCIAGAFTYHQRKRGGGRG